MISQDERERTIAWYDRNAPSLCMTYDKADPAALHGLLRHWVKPGDRVLELGCGSGRDARFLASLGARVTATDGSREMLREAEAKGGGPEYALLPLPAGRKGIEAAGIAGAFDVVLAVALIMHFADDALRLVLRDIDSLSSPEAALILSFCTGHPREEGRAYHDHSAEQVALLMRESGFEVAERTSSRDSLGRGIAWHTMVFRRVAEKREP